MGNDKNIKILIIGAGDFPIYETALYNAFIDLGYHNCKLLVWKDFFKRNDLVMRVSTRTEMRFGCGYQIKNFNNRVVKECEGEKYNIVFLYTCRIVFASTVKRIREMGIFVISYCNDDPFSDRYKNYFWRNYRKSLKFCQINYVYRSQNIMDVYEECGRRGELLRAYYIESDNYICNENELIKETPDVIFLGHIENDERTEYIKILLDKGISVGLNEVAYGEWGKNKENVIFLKNPREWYNRYLCSCKIPLVFLSKLNRDTYTRRCFEIPAAGAFLFCPYTDDLASMFAEDEEIVFFRSKKEFVEKIEYYLTNDYVRERIASAGHDRLLKDKHEIKDRVKQIINDYCMTLQKIEEKNKGGACQ